MTTIVHVACAGVEHMGRIEGEDWKKAKKRQMIVLYDAVKVMYAQDKEGNLMMNLTDMKKRQLEPGGPVETKYEGTVYLNPNTNTIYIWPLQTNGDLYKIYMNTLRERSILEANGPRVVPPSSPQQTRTPIPMGPRRTKH